MSSVLQSNQGGQLNTYTHPISHSLFVPYLPQLGEGFVNGKSGRALTPLRGQMWTSKLRSWSPIPEGKVRFSVIYLELLSVCKTVTLPFRVARGGTLSPLPVPSRAVCPGLLEFQHPNSSLPGFSEALPPHPLPHSRTVRSAPSNEFHLEVCSGVGG